MAQLDDADWRLSMATSRKPKVERFTTRNLLVHRLSDTVKVVLRRPLRDSVARGEVTRLSAYCEPCEQWVASPGIPDIYRCEVCRRQFRIEFVVYEEVDPDDE
jgi:hypothetical protein